MISVSVRGEDVPYLVHRGNGRFHRLVCNHPGEVDAISIGWVARNPRKDPEVAGVQVLCRFELVIPCSVPERLREYSVGYGPHRGFAARGEEHIDSLADRM